MGIGIGVLSERARIFVGLDLGQSQDPSAGSGTGGSFSRRNGLGDLRKAAAAAVSRAVCGAIAVGNALSKSGAAGAEGCAAIGAAGRMSWGFRRGCRRREI